MERIQPKFFQRASSGKKYAYAARGFDFRRGGDKHFQFDAENRFRAACGNFHIECAWCENPFGEKYFHNARIFDLTARRDCWAFARAFFLRQHKKRFYASFVRSFLSAKIFRADFFSAKRFDAFGKSDVRSLCKHSRANVRARNYFHNTVRNFFRGIFSMGCEPRNFERFD